MITPIARTSSIKTMKMKTTAARVPAGWAGVEAAVSFIEIFNKK
jgi:hypothetical protein